MSVAAMETEEAPEYPPPPAYYRMFAPPKTSYHTDEEHMEPPLPPPALPREGSTVNVFGFAIPFLDQERYDPIVAPEQRAHSGREEDRGKLKMMVVDYQAELSRLLDTTVESFLKLLEAMKTGSQENRVAILGEMCAAIDNMYDVLSAYRQRQATGQVTERIELQIEERKRTIEALSKQIAQSRSECHRASDTLLQCFATFTQDIQSATPMDT